MSSRSSRQIQWLRAYGISTHKNLFRKQYDENLRRKPSPVRFDRNACGELILPGQWFLAKVEELANNPALGEEQRMAALRLSRVAMVEDIILPAEIQTLALSVPNADGTTTLLEALPGGYILNMNVAG